MMLLRALAPLSSGFVASNGAVARRAGLLSQLRFRLAVPALHPLNHTRHSGGMLPLWQWWSVGEP